MATIILKNLYHNGEQVKEIIQNGDIIYVGAQKLVFDVDKDNISFEDTGGSTTITITANDKWTMTKPEWITASQTSGTSTATITLSASATETERTGNIVIACGGKTKTISVIQAQDYSSMYFTIEALEDGTLAFKQSQSENETYYSKNAGAWITFNRSINIPVEKGDKVRFKSTNHQEPTFTGTTLSFNVYGNIMSLMYGDNYQNQTKLIHNFEYLFSGCTGLVDAGNLYIPDNLDCSDLGGYTLRGVFMGCTSLTSAPVLVNTFETGTFPGGLYALMFNGCSSLNRIECYAYRQRGSSISNDFAKWVQNVSATGTFVKKAGVNWPTGVSGIPSGWTVIEE